VSQYHPYFLHPRFSFCGLNHYWTDPYFPTFSWKIFWLDDYFHLSMSPTACLPYSLLRIQKPELHLTLCWFYYIFSLILKEYSPHFWQRAVGTVDLILQFPHSDEFKIKLSESCLKLHPPLPNITREACQGSKPIWQRIQETWEIFSDVRGKHFIYVYNNI